jgi:hypothetical protein
MANDIRDQVSDVVMIVTMGATDREQYRVGIPSAGPGTFGWTPARPHMATPSRKQRPG